MIMITIIEGYCNEKKIIIININDRQNKIAETHSNNNISKIQYNIEEDSTVQDMLIF